MDESINRKSKDRLFSFIFGRYENRAWTLSLYNAVNGTSYSDPEMIEITTMEDAVYMGMKNDVSFMIHSTVSLYEQQSSFNPNMPVRQLMYLGRLYDKHIKRTKQNQFGSKLMALPMPKLVTFYNGVADVEDSLLRLSDSFPKECDPAESDVEVRVHMINIKPDHHGSVLKGCKVLYEYSWFVEEVRKNRKTLENEEAVDKAIRDMPEDFEIKSFLLGNQAEVKNMCLTEYDEAETMEMFREEGREEGLKEGLREGQSRIIMKMLEKGKSPAEIADLCDLPIELVSKVEDESHSKDYSLIEGKDK